MSEQLDRIEANQGIQGEQINRIIQVLGGDKKLGTKGLVEDHGEVKKLAYKNKEELSKIKTKVAIITGAISTAWGGFVTWLNT